MEERRLQQEEEIGHLPPQDCLGVQPKSHIQIVKTRGCIVGAFQCAGQVVRDVQTVLILQCILASPSCCD